MALKLTPNLPAVSAFSRCDRIGLIGAAAQLSLSLDGTKGEPSKHEWKALRQYRY
jgi:hypothetical protein